MHASEAELLGQYADRGLVKCVNSEPNNGPTVMLAGYSQEGAPNRHQRLPVFHAMVYLVILLPCHEHLMLSS